jgi:hypothetical protein
VVTWELNGGSWAEGAAPVNQAAEGAILPRPADPVKEGSLLAGWYKDAALTTPWDFSEDRVTGDITRMRRGKSSRFWRTFTFLAVPAAALLSGGLVWALK